MPTGLYRKVVEQLQTLRDDVQVDNRRHLVEDRCGDVDGTGVREPQRRFGRRRGDGRSDLRAEASPIVAEAW